MGILVDRINGIKADLAAAYAALALKGAALPNESNRGTSQLESTVNTLRPAAETPKKAINFYDYDGTRLFSFDSYSDLSYQKWLKCIPPNHIGLTFSGWNFTQAQARSYAEKYGFCDISAIYATDDGKTRLYITIPGADLLSPTLYFQAADGTLTVDWGDGSAADTATAAGSSYENVTKQHTYSAPGSYVIKLSFAGSGGYILGQSSGLFGSTSTSAASAFPYANMLTATELGESCTVSSSAFSNSYSLRTVMLPRGIIEIPESAFYSCGCLKYVSLPDTLTSIGKSAFAACSGVGVFGIPPSVSVVSNTAFQYCRSMNIVGYSEAVSAVNASAFSYCFALVRMMIPDTVTAIGTGSFAYSRNFAVLDLSLYSDPDNIPTLTNVNAFSNTNLTTIYVKNSSMLAAFTSASATNWNTFSSLFAVKGA